MRSIRTLNLAAWLAAALGLGALAPVPAAEPAAPDLSALGGSDRYLTHVSTDKPVYRPGDAVYVRGVLLHARTDRPWSEDASVQAKVEVRGPKGEVVVQGTTGLEDSALGFRWEIPDEQAGGQFKVKVSYPNHGFAPAQREFEVRRYEPPRLRTEVTFLRDGYGAGDTVQATLEVTRAEGGVPRGAPVTVVARVDGAEVYRGRATVDADGRARTRFDLPATIERGQGSLAFVIEDGGVVETASKTLPLILKAMDVRVFPEGGELVAGLPARVYIEARTPAKKPADLVAALVDASGRELARVRTDHEGRGRLEFTPDAGGAYRLEVVEPAGVEVPVGLPAVREHGAVVAATADAYPAAGGVPLRVAATRTGWYTLQLSRRERLLAKSELRLKAGRAVTVPLDPEDDLGGVLRATLYGEDGQPLAERLVYRRPARHLSVEVLPGSARSTPGGEVEVTVRVRDQRGRPVAAQVGLTVTDDRAREVLEDRDLPPALPAMAYLEPEVRELADAAAYLDPQDPDAARNLDLLLGTQGWRRFAFVDVAAFARKHGDAGARVLALRKPVRRWPRGGWGGGRFRAMRKGGGPVMAFGAAPVPEVAAMPMAVPPPPAPMDAPGPDEGGAEALAPGADRQPARQRQAPPRAERDLRAPAASEAVAGKVVAGLIAGDALADEEFVLGDVANRFAPMPHEPPVNFQVFRVYAHDRGHDWHAGRRRDFTETVYWTRGVATDAATGEATVRFHLSDSVTSYRVLADAYASTGALGAGDAEVEAVKPFYLTAKLPRSLTAGDQVAIPVTMVNATDRATTSVHLGVEAPQEVRARVDVPRSLAPGARVRRLLRLDTGAFLGGLDLKLLGSAGELGDSVDRTLTISPRGFPQEANAGGLLEPGGAGVLTVTVPEDAVGGSVSGEVVVYTSPLANLTQALERLIREPYGCFEQTSSTTYPLVMAQQYFLSHPDVDPALIQKSAGILKKGYERLIGFECKKVGFEWFGADPGHEALTAYGLLEFTDMSLVQNVDQAMLERSKKWLLGQRDGEGGFKRERRALHTWLAQPDVSNAYITWALAESGAEGLGRELDALVRTANESESPYVWALTANALQRAGQGSRARGLLDRLASKQDAEGVVQGSEVSIVGSKGLSLQVEATALAVSAWLRSDAHQGAVEKGAKWLFTICEGGRFGSTQSTVLALRAIVAYDEARSQPKAPGSLSLYLGGRRVKGPVKFDESSKEAMTLSLDGVDLEAGTHRLEVRMEGGSRMPWSGSVRFHRTLPATSAQRDLDLETWVRDDTVTEGEVTELVVAVQNRTGEAVPNPVAILGLPGGMSPRHDQLKELVKAGEVAAYEVREQDLVLYWRVLEANAKVRIPVDLVADVPGRYQAPASRAYPYYADEHKAWVPGVKVEVDPR